MRLARFVAVVFTLLLLGAFTAAQQPAQPPIDPNGRPAGDPKAQPKDDPKAKKDEPKYDPLAEQIASDERVLREVKEGTDGASLVTYFKKRTYPPADPKRLERLVRELGDKAFAVREKAHTELIDLGASAMEAVKGAESAGDWEVRKRAIEIRRRIEQKADPVVQSAVARLIAARKPDGAATVLLNYLPFAADDSVVEEICKALPEVTIKGGKVDAAVVTALTDKLPIKRGAAAAALVNAGAKGQYADARKLLDDKDASVRLRVGLALASRLREKDAITKLIDAIEHLPPEQLWAAEELLIRFAGEKAPQVSLGNDAGARAKAKQAWQEWWDGVKDKIDLAKLELKDPYLNYTLIVERTFNRIVGGVRQPPTGLIRELDGGKPPNVRWKLEINTYPVDAQLVGPDRVLVAEFQGQRVSERNFKGEVKWEKAVNGNPLSAQRLVNGNTFVVMQNRLAEYDRTGKEVYSMDRPQFDTFRGRKLRNGDVVYITAQGQLTRVDPKNNKTLATFNVGPMGSQFGNFEVLPNGNYLIPVYNNQRVVEFDPTGKQVWTAQVQFPSSAQRLPNGNTLVASQVQRKVVELDRNGREVWSFMGEGQVFVARRR